MASVYWRAQTSGDNRRLAAFMKFWPQRPEASAMPQSAEGHPVVCLLWDGMVSVVWYMSLNHFNLNRIIIEPDRNSSVRLVKSFPSCNGHSRNWEQNQMLKMPFWKHFHGDEMYEFWVGSPEPQWLLSSGLPQKVLGRPTSEVVPCGPSLLQRQFQATGHCFQPTSSQNTFQMCEMLRGQEN